jgi:hypothetical protein
MQLGCFAFSPSAGDSRGILVVWNSGLYSGDVIQRNSYAATVELTSLIDNNCLHLSNIMGLLILLVN